MIDDDLPAIDDRTRELIEAEDAWLEHNQRIKAIARATTVPGTRPAQPQSNGNGVVLRGRNGTIPGARRLGRNGTVVDDPPPEGEKRVRPSDAAFAELDTREIEVRGVLDRARRDASMLDTEPPRAMPMPSAIARLSSNHRALVPVNSAEDSYESWSLAPDAFDDNYYDEPTDGGPSRPYDDEDERLAEEPTYDGASFDSVRALKPQAIELARRHAIVEVEQQPETQPMEIELPPPSEPVIESAVEAPVEQPVVIEAPIEVRPPAAFPSVAPPPPDVAPRSRVRATHLALIAVAIFLAAAIVTYGVKWS